MDMANFAIPSFGPVVALLRLVSYVLPPLLLARVLSRQASRTPLVLPVLVALLPAFLCGIAALWNAFVFVHNLIQYSGPSAPLAWSGLAGSAGIARFGIPGALLLLMITAFLLYRRRPTGVTVPVARGPVSSVAVLLLTAFLVGPMAVLTFPPAAILSPDRLIYLQGCQSLRARLILVGAVLIAFTAIVVVFALIPRSRHFLRLDGCGRVLLFVAAFALLVLTWSLGSISRRHALEGARPSTTAQSLLHPGA